MGTTRNGHGYLGKALDKTTGEYTWRQGCSVREIALMMGISEQNVRQILRKALRKLAADEATVNLYRRYVDCNYII